MKKQKRITPSSASKAKKIVSIILAVMLVTLTAGLFAVPLLSENDNDGTLNDSDTNINNGDDSSGDGTAGDGEVETADIVYTYFDEKPEITVPYQGEFSVAFDQINVEDYSYVTLSVDIINLSDTALIDGNTTILPSFSLSASALQGRDNGEIETLSIVFCNSGIAKGTYVFLDETEKLADYAVRCVIPSSINGLYYMVQDPSALNLDGYYLANLRIECYSPDYEGNIDDVYENVQAYNNSGTFVDSSMLDVTDDMLS